MNVSARPTRAAAAPPTSAEPATATAATARIVCGPLLAPRSPGTVLAPGRPTAGRSQARGPKSARRCRRGKFEFTGFGFGVGSEFEFEFTARSRPADPSVSAAPAIQSALRAARPTSGARLHKTNDSTERASFIFTGPMGAPVPRRLSAHRALSCGPSYSGARHSCRRVAPRQLQRPSEFRPGLGL